MRKTCNIHIRNTNIGDVASGPFEYFDELKNFPIKPIECWAENCDVAVLGGGGLLGSMMDVLWDSSSLPRMNVIWGVGTNIHHTRAPVHPTWLNRFPLVGLRDYGTPFEYVPCASCMSPLFNRPRPKATAPMVVYSHHQFEIPIPDVPHLTNTAPRLEDVLDFLASGKVVVTNSYHGVYWAQLLGRRVIIWCPFSNRFLYFQHQPPIHHESQPMAHSIDESFVPPASFLNECRERNIAFKNKVITLL